MYELVSIIIPIHNGEKTLSRCVDSLLANDNTYFEILLLDYDSKDLSSQICEQYAVKDKRVRVFHIHKLPNEREKYYLPTILNLAIKNAKGSWITFLKQEDWVKKHYLIFLKYYQPIQRNNLYMCARWEGSTADTLKRVKTKIHSGPFTEESLQNIQDNLTIYGKFYSKRVINYLQLRFDENIFYGYEDIFTLRYLKEVKEISFFARKFNYFGIKTLDNICFNADFDTHYHSYCLILDTVQQTWDKDYKNSWFIKYFKFLVYFCLQEKVSYQQKKTNLNKIRNIPNTKDILLDLINLEDKNTTLWQLFLKRKYSHLLIIGVLQSKLLFSLYAHQKYSLLKHYLK